MRFGRRKITYYDTEAGFEAEKFAARLLLLLMNEDAGIRAPQDRFYASGQTGPRGTVWDRSSAQSWRRR